MSEHPTHVPHRPVAVTVDGERHDLLPGRSLAAALIGADRPVTRHDRAGRPRAPFCAMGVCFECALTVDGVPLVRACQEPVRAGMTVQTGRGPHAASTAASTAVGREERT